MGTIVFLLLIVMFFDILEWLIHLPKNILDKRAVNLATQGKLNVRQ